MKSGELTIRKEPTATNWADLGTKALNGSRITELLQIMPLTRRGIVVACLLCIIDGANGQPEGEEKSSTGTIGSVLMMIVCALIGLIMYTQCIIRWLRMKNLRSPEKETQTEPARPVWLPKVSTKEVGTQTDGFAIPVGASSGPERIEAKASSQAASSNQQASGASPGGAGSTTLPKAAAMPQLRDRRNANDLVWLVGSGVRYHRENCGILRANRGRSRQVSRGVAIQRGYTACQQCGG